MPAIAAVGQVAITNGIIGVNYAGGNYVPIYGSNDSLGFLQVPASSISTKTVINASGIYNSMILEIVNPSNVAHLLVQDGSTGANVLDTLQVGSLPVILPWTNDTGAGWNIQLTTNAGGQAVAYIYGSRLPLAVAVSNVGLTPLNVSLGAQYGTGNGQYISTRATTVPVLQQVIPAVAATYSYTVAIDPGISGIKLAYNAITSVGAIDVFGTQTNRFFYRSTKVTRRPIYIPLPAAYDTQVTIRITITAAVAVTLWVEEVFGFEIPAIASNHPGNLSYITNAGLTNSTIPFAALTPPVGLEGWDVSASILVPPGSAAVNEAVVISMVGDTSGSQVVLANFVFACPTIAAGAQGVTLSDSKTVHMGSDFFDTDATFALDSTYHILVQYGSFNPAIGITLYPL